MMISILSNIPCQLTNFWCKQNEALVAIVTEITLHNTVAKWKIDAKPKKEMKKYGKP
jgi:hypothetical protein